jgi:hypothetical protein
MSISQISQICHNFLRCILWFQKEPSESGVIDHIFKSLTKIVKIKAKFRVKLCIPFQETELFVCLQPHEQFFSYLAAVIITGDRAANLGLCSPLRAFEQGGIFIVPHLLRHGASVYTASSERPAPTSHSGIRTPDARIIGVLYGKIYEVN